MSDSFGDRMKGYEAASETVLPRRLPVILRLDGNSFSRFTESRGFTRPFDPAFERAMDKAALGVMDYTQALCAYVQSDEITLLLRNDRVLNETPFLGNRVQKLVSQAAATAAVSFMAALAETPFVVGAGAPVFDCRAFVVPEDEVNNVFLWRQKDAFKNAVGSVCYWGLVEKYNSKSKAASMLDGKSTNDRQEIMFSELGLNADTLRTSSKRGRMVTRQFYTAPIEECMNPSMLADLVARGKVVAGSLVRRRRMVVNDETPRFEDGTYIGQFLK